MRFWITKNSEVPVREQLVRQVLLGILSEDFPRRPQVAERSSAGAAAWDPFEHRQCRLSRSASARLAGTAERQRSLCSAP